MKLITTKTKGVTALNNENLEGKILILDAKFLVKEYRKPENQIWLATGGFGCDPNLRGTTIFCTALADGEEYRWDRTKIIGFVDQKFADQYIKK